MVSLTGDPLDGKKNNKAGWQVKSSALGLAACFLSGQPVPFFMALC